MSDFVHHEMFPLGPDTTEYRQLTSDYVGTSTLAGRDVLTINVEVDRLWGITGGQYCAMRLPEEDRSTIIWVDLQKCEPVHEVTNLHRWAHVDAENGLVLEPTRSAGLLEREMHGQERRVLRSLPNDEWISFGWKGILDNSEGAAGVI